MAKKENIVAVEVMNNAIRAAEIEGYNTQRPKLLRYGMMPLPEGIADDGAFRDPDRAGKLLKSLWSKSGFVSKDVALGISSRSIIVKEQKLPNIPEKKLRQTIHLEVAESLPNQMGNAVIDFYPIEKTPGENSVTALIVAARYENIDSIIIPFMFAGLNIEYVDYSPFGLGVSTRKAIGESGEYLTVNINSKNSEHIVIKDGILRLARIVPEGIRVAPEPVEDEYGDYFYDSPYLDPSEEQAERVLSEIASTISYHESRGGKIGNVLIAGEGTASEHLKERISPALRKSVSFLDLDTVIGSATEQESEKQDDFIESSIISTIGIGMRGLK